MLPIGHSVAVLSLVLTICSNCTEVASGYGDCFSFAGNTFNADDNSPLEGVAVRLTDFRGNFEEPVVEQTCISDSNGAFFLDCCPGNKKIEKWNGTTIYKFDSCKAVFSKSGYIGDAVVIINDDTKSSYVSMKYMRKMQ